LAVCVLVGAILSSCADGTNVDPESGSPTIRSTGSIVFAEGQPPPTRLYARTPGEDAVPLVSDDLLKGSVAWSPDGDSIAFTEYDLDRWVERLVLVRGNGTDERVVCESCTATFEVQRQETCGIDSCSEPGAWPMANRIAWSPSGDAIAAIAADGSATTIIDVATGSARHVDVPGSSRGLSWSPDGSALAVTVDARGDAAGLYVVEAATGVSTQLLAAEPYYAPPAWSSNGIIAFPKRVNVNGGLMAELLYVEVDSGQSRTVLDANVLFEIYDLEWSPDGTRLAVLHHPVEPPTAALLTIDQTGAGVQMIALCENGTDPDGLCTTNGGEVSWSGDGRSIAFENTDGQRRGFLALDLFTGERSWLTDGGYGCCISWQPATAESGPTA